MQKNTNNKNYFKMNKSIKDKYIVRSIDSFLCKEWLLKKHYAKRLCSISYSFGLFENDILIGICTFGMPPSSTLAESICGKEYSKIVLELNRLVVNDRLEKNVLSFFVSNCLSIIPKPNIIVSFSDSNMGHNGYIYQACNFIYTGLSSNVTKLIDKDGIEFHFRNIGHYQKNNRLKVGLIKRRLNEQNIDKVQIAEYLRKNKGNIKSKNLDLIFGYKDTCSHWFRTDVGFSFPSVDDWIKLKEILKLDNSLDNIMLPYEMIPDSNEIIKKLELKKIEILPKHRYIYVNGNKYEKKNIMNKLNYKILPYPKGENKRYDSSYQPTIQKQLF
jgi:hypothetical protein